MRAPPLATSFDRIPPGKLGISIAAALALTAAIRYLFDPLLGDSDPYILFVFPALFIANRAGLRPAFITLLLGLATANALFASPRMSLWVSAPENQLGLLFYLAVGGAGIYLADARRTAQFEAEAHAKDITAESVAHRRTQQSLGEQQARLLDHTFDPILTWDMDERISYWNAGAERLYGYSAEEAVGRTCRELLGTVYLSGLQDPLATTKDRIENPLAALLREGHWEGELRHRTKSGVWLTVDSRRGVVHNAPDAPQVFEAIRDVTVHRQAEASIHDALERFRGVVNQAADGIITIDERGTIEMSNPALTRIFGYESAELLGQNVSMLMPQPFRDAHDGYLANYLRTGEAKVIGLGREVRGRRKDGSEFPLELTVTEIQLARGRLFTGMVRDVTARAQAEGALRASEERLRLYLESVPAPIAMLDRNMRYLYYSNRWLSDYRLSEQNLLGLSHYDVFPDLPETWKAIHRRCLAGETIRSEEDRFERGDGATQWIRWEVRPWHEADGTIGGIIIFSEDITSRKQSEQVLRDRERLLGIVTASARVGLVVVNRSYQYIFANEAYASIFGLDAGQMVGRKVYELLPDGWLQIQPQLDRAFRGEQVSYELSLPPAKNSSTPRWFRVMYEPRLEDSGNPSVVVVVMDITEHKRIEQAIREMQQRLAHVVSSSPAVLFTLAIENEQIQGISWISDNLQDLLGYSAEAVRESNWWLENIHPAERDSLVAQTQRELFTQGHSTHEYRFRQGNGKYLWTRGEIRLIRDNAGRAVEAVGSWSDVTERKQLETQFQQAQKMEAFGQLAGGVAHDFNNLLTVINGYSELLLAGMSEHHQDREPLRSIRDAGERAASLTRQLLAFSRQSMLETQILDPNAVVSESAKMLNRLIGEDVQLSVALDPHVGKVKADPSQLGQVLMNLAVNARDAMPTGGRLTVETLEVLVDAADSIGLADARPGRYAMIAVTDTGTGMTDAVKARVFEPFFTTKEIGKGTGLGLATVFGIVKQSGGRLEVYSELGVGTTFKIYLPVIEEGEVAEKSREPARIRGGNESILLVEDQADVRQIALMGLESHGYSVRSASDGLGALTSIERDQPPLDILVTDVVMPGMSGRELAKKVRLLYPGIKVLFMSGYTEDAVIRHGILQEDVAFIRKPFTPNSLAIKVRQVLDGVLTR